MLAASAPRVLAFGPSVLRAAGLNPPALGPGPAAAPAAAGSSRATPLSCRAVLPRRWCPPGRVRQPEVHRQATGVAKLNHPPSPLACTTCLEAPRTEQASQTRPILHHPPWGRPGHIRSSTATMCDNRRAPKDFVLQKMCGRPFKFLNFPNVCGRPKTTKPVNQHVWFTRAA